jgi:hypothetical protein
MSVKIVGMNAAASIPADDEFILGIRIMAKPLTSGSSPDRKMFQAGYYCRRGEYFMEKTPVQGVPDIPALRHLAVYDGFR